MDIYPACPSESFNLSKVAQSIFQEKQFSCPYFIVNVILRYIHHTVRNKYHNVKICHSVHMIKAIRSRKYVTVGYEWQSFFIH